MHEWKYAEKSARVLLTHADENVNRSVHINTPIHDENLHAIFFNDAPSLIAFYEDGWRDINDRQMICWVDSRAYKGKPHESPEG